MHQTILALSLVLALVTIIVVSSITCWLKHKRYRVASAERARSAASDRARVLQAAKTASEVRSPACFISFDKLRAIGRFERYEVLRDAGLLTTFDTFPALTHAAEHFPTAFFSHQWLAKEEPDPQNTHFDALLRACSWLCTRHNLPEETLHCWIDFCSIPQANEYQKRLAIDTLAVYASATRFFVTLAPDAIHHDTGLACNDATYISRGWCRLEQWARLATGGLEEMYVLRGDALSVPEPLHGDDEHLRDIVSVFAGEFANLDDKPKLVDACLGLWMIGSLRKQPTATRIFELIEQDRAAVFPEVHFRGLVEIAQEMVSVVEQASSVGNPRLEEAESLRLHHGAAIARARILNHTYGPMAPTGRGSSASHLARNQPEGAVAEAPESSVASEQGRDEDKEEPSNGALPMASRTQATELDDSSRHSNLSSVAALQPREHGQRREFRGGWNASMGVVPLRDLQPLHSELPAIRHPRRQTRSVNGEMVGVRLASTSVLPMELAELPAELVQAKAQRGMHRHESHSSVSQSGSWAVELAALSADSTALRGKLSTAAQSGPHSPLGRNRARNGEPDPANLERGQPTAPAPVSALRRDRLSSWSVRELMAPGKWLSAARSRLSEASRRSGASRPSGACSDQSGGGSVASRASVGC